jgi:hypothetical protein
MDDRDLEIARLKGQLEAREAMASRGGAGTGTLKVLGVLAAVVIGGVLLLAEPSEALNQCLFRNLARQLERQRR